MDTYIKINLFKMIIILFKIKRFSKFKNFKNFINKLFTSKDDGFFPDITKFINRLDLLHSSTKRTSNSTVDS